MKHNTMTNTICFASSDRFAPTTVDLTLLSIQCSTTCQTCMAHKRWHTDSLQYKCIHYMWNIITHYSYCITLPCCCTNCKECTFRQHFCRVPSSTQPVLAACVSAKVIMRLKVASRSPQKSFFENFSLWRSWSCWCLPNLPKIWTQCSLNTSLFGWFTKRNVRWRPRSIRALGIASVLGVFSPSPPLSPSPPSPPQVKYLLNRMSGPSVWPQLPGFCCMRWPQVIMRVGGPSPSQPLIDRQKSWMSGAVEYCLLFTAYQTIALCVYQ